LQHLPTISAPDVSHSFVIFFNDDGSDYPNLVFGLPLFASPKFEYLMIFPIMGLSIFHGLKSILFPFYMIDYL